MCVFVCVLLLFFFFNVLLLFSLISVALAY